MFMLLNWHQDDKQKHDDEIYQCLIVPMGTADFIFQPEETSCIYSSY